MENLEPIEIQEIDSFNEDDSELFIELIKILEERCKNANIEFVKNKDELLDEEVYEIRMPSGRKKRSVIVCDFEDAMLLSNFDFENYILFNEYSAICSYTKGIIEALIQVPNRIPPRAIKRRLFGKDIQPEDEVCATVEQSKELGDLKVSIGQPSQEILSLIRHNRYGQNGLSLKIEGVICSTYDKALNILEDISNAIFFQIDLNKNIPLTISRETKIPISVGSRNNNDIREDLKFPNTLYDLESVSLYWYARNSTGIPLLQFLAFYQSIEFYFPVYSEIEAKKAVRNILKNPTFNPNNDIDITRVLTTIKSKVGKGFDNERSQLKATLKECINVEQLKLFLSENKYLVDFYASNDCKKLSKNKINVGISDDELINIVSERIYDIRCKIVHTKANENEGNIELLLPFSKEIEYLYYDIELIKYIAQQVIISNGKNFII